MTPALRYLITASTCPRCQGEGVLHSRAVRYVGEPAWHTHLACELCRGSGINPAMQALMNRP